MKTIILNERRAWRSRDRIILVPIMGILRRFNILEHRSLGLTLTWNLQRFQQASLLLRLWSLKLIWVVQNHLLLFLDFVLLDILLFHFLFRDVTSECAIWINRRQEPNWSQHFLKCGVLTGIHRLQYSCRCAVVSKGLHQIRKFLKRCGQIWQRLIPRILVKVDLCTLILRRLPL